jgi:BMFP domain-containing protein YqiC
MFGKSDLVDSLSRDLARARDKRDALTSDVTALTSKIAELEARLGSGPSSTRRILFVRHCFLTI